MTTPYKPHLVAPNRTGVDLGLDPWLIPEDAFQDLQDGYNYLGVTYKREGYSWFDAIPHALNANGMAYQNVANITTFTGPGVTVTTTAAHELLSGTIVRLTNVQNFSPDTGESPLNGTRWTITVTSTTTFTLNNTIGYTGSYTPTTGTVSIFPGLPVMMFATWVDTTQDYQIVVADTRRAAYYDSSALNLSLVPIGNVDQFTGSLKNLFWWENYKGYLFITNDIDNIFYWNNTPAQILAGLTPFLPVYEIIGGVDQVVLTCLMIKAVGNRLCLFNTIETDAAHPTRIRWCNVGIDPVLTPDAWYQATYVPGRGNYYDALDSQYLISLAQIQNNVILFSQGQQLGIVYIMGITNDPVNAFVFIKISNSRNVNTTFGTILLDRQVLAFGNAGIITTDGNSVGRIDDKIPEFAVQDIIQANFAQCFGIRNDAYWQSWLAYPSSDSVSGNNDKILVFNYKDQAWYFYNISMSVLGLAPDPVLDPTWASFTDGKRWVDFDNGETWASFAQLESFLLFGGDYQGNIWYMNYGGGDAAEDITYGEQNFPGFPIEFKLTSRQWTPFLKQSEAAEFGYIDFLIDADPNTIVQMEVFTDNVTNPILTTYFTCVPFENLTGGPITNITSAPPNTLIQAANHGLFTGDIIWIYAVQGMTELNNATYTVTVIDNNNFSIDIDSSGFTPYLIDGVFSLNRIVQSTFWTRVYVGQTGVFHQIILTALGTDETFALHGLIAYFKPTGRIFKG
jgi:Ubiquitin-activating enzyme E1 FCCH domain